MLSPRTGSGSSSSIDLQPQAGRGSSPPVLNPADRAGSLRIAINTTAAVTGGGMTYWLNILPALARIARPHQYHILYGPIQQKIRIDLPDNFHFHYFHFGRPRVYRRVIWGQTGILRFLRRESIDVLLAPGDLAPLRSPCPFVLAIRNPTPHYGPRASTLKGRLRLWTLRNLTRMSAHRAEHVYFVSNDSRRRIAFSLRIPIEKTSVVYHGIGEHFLSPSLTNERQVPARRPYLLSVSAINNHKDFETLIRAFAVSIRCCEALRGREMIIAGKNIDPPYFEHLRRLVADLGIGDAVRFCGEVPYPELPPLYRGAELFILPSLAETFGHPLVEAMASGVPVLTTDLPIMREICGEAAEYFEPAAVEDLAAKMSELITNHELRRARVAAGLARAGRYSWQRCASETLDLLEGAARPERRQDCPTTLTAARTSR